MKFELKSSSIPYVVLKELTEPNYNVTLVEFDTTLSGTTQTFTVDKGTLPDGSVIKLYIDGIKRGSDIITPETDIYVENLANDARVLDVYLSVIVAGSVIDDDFKVFGNITASGSTGESPIDLNVNSEDGEGIPLTLGNVAVYDQDPPGFTLNEKVLAVGSSINTAASFTQDPNEHEMVTPAPATVLAGSDITFQWQTNGSDASQWYLRAGDTVGSSEYFDLRITDGTVRSQRITGLPTDGRVVHIEFSRRDAGGLWHIQNLEYVAVGGGTETLAGIAITSAATQKTDNGMEITINDPVAAKNPVLQFDAIAPNGLWMLVNCIADDGEEYSIRYVNQTFANGLVGLPLNIGDLSTRKTIKLDIEAQLLTSYGATFDRIKNFRVKANAEIYSLVLTDDKTSLTALQSITPSVEGNNYGSIPVGSISFSAATGNILPSGVTAFSIVSFTNVTGLTIDAATGAYSGTVGEGAASVTFSMSEDGTEVGQATDNFVGQAQIATGTTKFKNIDSRSVVSVPEAIRSQYGYSAKPGLPCTVPSEIAGIPDFTFALPSSYDTTVTVSTASEFVAAVSARAGKKLVQIVAPFSLSNITIPASGGGVSDTTDGRMIVDAGGIANIGHNGGRTYLQASNIAFINQRIRGVWRLNGAKGITYYNCDFSPGGTELQGHNGNHCADIRLIGCKSNPQGGSRALVSNFSSLYPSSSVPNSVDVIMAYCDLRSHLSDKAYSGVSSCQNYPDGHDPLWIRHYRNYYKDCWDEVMSIKGPNHWIDQCLIDGSTGYLSLRATDNTIVTRTAIVNNSARSLQVAGYDNVGIFNVLLSRNSQGLEPHLSGLSTVALECGLDWTARIPTVNNDFRYNIIGSSNGSDVTAWLHIRDVYSQFDRHKQIGVGPDIPTGNTIRENVILAPNNAGIVSQNNRINISEYTAANPNGRQEQQSFPSRNADGTYTNPDDITWPNSVTIPNKWKGHDIVVSLPDLFVGVNALVKIS